jgi:hypothetical protein
MNRIHGQQPHLPNIVKGAWARDAMTGDEAARRAAYYRHMAAEARAKAETMKDFPGRKTMVEVARLWDGVAADADRAANSN